MACKIATLDSINMTSSVTIDFRSAAASGSRREIMRCRELVERTAAAGLSLEILWPRDKHLPIAAHFLQISLLSFVTATCEEFGVQATLHTRGTQVREFMHVTPSDGVSVLYYLNSEEAAMRWEADEPLPARRLAAAIRVVDAGWNVNWIIGGVRLFPGWKEEYEDMLQQLAEAGIRDIKVAFAGEASLPFEDSQGKQHIVPVVTRSGVRFTVAERQRREVESFFSSTLASAA